MWNSIKTFFGRLFFWFYCNSRWFSTWAKIYQFCRERYWDKIVQELPRFYHVEDLALTLIHMQYRYDGLSELGDAASSAKAVWGRYKNRMKVGDCEDFGNFIACVIRNSIAAGYWTDPVWSDAMLMLVTWMTAEGKIEGHGVALLIGAQLGKPVFAYQDYGQPSIKSGDIETVVKNIQLVYGAAGYTSLGWALFQSDSLKLMRSSWK